MINTLDFYNELIHSSIDFFTGVPDSLLANLCACIKENSSREKNVIAANEGNAIAMAAGYHIATGKIGCVYMQNSGEGNAVNPLLSLADEEVYSIPILLIIGWRGEPGVHDEPQHVKQGKLTCALLETMGINYLVLSEDYKLDLQTAISYMHDKSKPFALVIRKGIFSKYETTLEPSPYILTRETALKRILSDLTHEDIIVSTTGKTSREIYEIREADDGCHSNDFLTVGSMGHTASIAFGMALGTQKKIWCIDGDGSFIMHMGSLAVIGSYMPENFKYILNDNNAHESVGGQPTCSKYLDLPGIMKACGFKEVIVAGTESEIDLGIDKMSKENGIAMIIRTKQGARSDLGRPATTPRENKKMLMKKISELK